MTHKTLCSVMRAIWFGGLALILITFMAPPIYAQDSPDSTEIAQAAAPSSGESAASEAPQPEAKPTFEVYGFAQLDMIYDFKQNNPDWFDVVRPTKLPSFPNEFGEDGHFYGGVRQTRFGAKATFPTSVGDVKTVFDFDLFGVGVDQGQTTIRLRHAYGELGQFGAGQTESPFMDLDVFPNSLDYWGPNGMLFFRNVQVRWMPIQGEHSLTVALERPGASADAGVYADRIQIQNIKARFPLPDLSAGYKYSGDWGYFKVAGMLREMKWDDTLQDEFDLSGSATGWGISLSSNIKVNEDTIRLQFIDGAGVQNYFNDAPVDVGIKNNFSNPVTPVTGEALPIRGYVAFLDHTWNEKFTSAVGYSRVDIDNSDGQASDAYKSGQYALGNLLYYPAKNVMMGAELQYGWRENVDGFTSDDYRIQFSFKYNFSASIGGK